MLQPLLHLHFVDVGRTVAAPAGVATHAAKCSDAPGMRIPRDAASQPPLAARPPHSLSLSPSPRLRRSRPAAYSWKSSVPTVDDVLPTGDGPGGQGRNTPSDPAREILAGGAELPGRGGDPDASTTEQGEGEASE
jgi:hypothetical protein